MAKSTYVFDFLLNFSERVFASVAFVVELFDTLSVGQNPTSWEEERRGERKRKGEKKGRAGSEKENVK